MAFKAARVIVSALLILGLNDRPDLYYMALRWMVCCIAAYGVFHAMELQESTWATVFGVIALLYNPVYPINLAYSTFSLVHIGTTVVMMTTIPVLGVKEVSRVPPEKVREATVIAFHQKKRI